MDTSEIYIKMCESADVIQERWKQCYGDYIYLGGDYILDRIGRLIPDICKKNVQKFKILRFVTFNYDQTDFFSHVNLATCIWLPCQDQLQQIIIDFVKNLLWRHDKAFEIALIKNEFRLISRIDNKNMEVNNSLYEHNYKTIEQLLLALIMKEKYNKIWNGEDWKLKGEKC